MAGRTAIIIGAGIGGLACSVALRRAGWTVRVHERASSARELGFGLGLAPNALAALRELGVAESVVRAGSMVRCVELRRKDGRPLRRFGVPVGLPTAVALRPDLYGALLAAVGDGVLSLGSEAMSFVQDDSEVVVHFKNGGTDAGTVLIGADGIHSTIRRMLHPDEPPPRASGFCALRGVAYGVAHHLDDLSGVGYLDDGIEAAAIRASADAVYWYMSMRDEDVANQAPQGMVNQYSAGFESSFRAILSATSTDEMRFDRLMVRDPIGRWGSGRVTLLGDAAHPVMPHTGQGAAQALEDAVAMGLALSGFSDHEVAVRQYEAVRSRRTQRFMKLGPRIARLTTTKSVIVQTLRALAIRSIPEQMVASLARGARSDPHAALRQGTPS